jgi:hypothetical protein
MLSLGDAGELSPNASAMLRISTLSAWAQLQVSSVQQGYLENVVKPYRSTLSSLWIASLRDYASIRIDSEFLHDTSSVVDSSYSSLGKEVLLPVRIPSTFVGTLLLIFLSVLLQIMGNHSSGRGNCDAGRRSPYSSSHGWQRGWRRHEEPNLDYRPQGANDFLLHNFRPRLRSSSDFISRFLFHDNSPSIGCSIRSSSIEISCAPRVLRIGHHGADDFRRVHQSLLSHGDDGVGGDTNPSCRDALDLCCLSDICINWGRFTQFDLSDSSLLANLCTYIEANDIFQSSKCNS